MKEKDELESGWYDYAYSLSNFIPFVGGYVSNYLANTLSPEVYYKSYYEGTALISLLSSSISSYIFVVSLTDSNNNSLEKIASGLATAGYIYNLYSLVHNQTLDLTAESSEPYYSLNPFWYSFTCKMSNFIPFVGGLVSNHLAKSVSPEVYYHGYSKDVVEALLITSGCTLLFDFGLIMDALSKPAEILSKLTTTSAITTISAIGLINLGYLYNFYEMNHNISDRVVNQSLKQTWIKSLQNSSNVKSIIENQINLNNANSLDDSFHYKNNTYGFEPSWYKFVCKYSNLIPVIGGFVSNHLAEILSPEVYYYGYYHDAYYINKLILIPSLASIFVGGTICSPILCDVIKPNFSTVAALFLPASGYVYNFARLKHNLSMEVLAKELDQTQIEWPEYETMIEIDSAGNLINIIDIA